MEDQTPHRLCKNCRPKPGPGKKAAGLPELLMDARKLEDPKRVRLLFSTGRIVYRSFISATAADEFLTSKGYGEKNR